MPFIAWNLKERNRDRKVYLRGFMIAVRNNSLNDSKQQFLERAYLVNILKALATTREQQKQKQK